MNAASLFSYLDSAGYDVLRILLSVLWQSTIVLAAAWALARFLRRRGVGIRHLLWTAAVCILPLLPLLTWGAARLGTPRAEIQIFLPYAAPEALMDSNLMLSDNRGKQVDAGDVGDAGDKNGSKKSVIKENTRPLSIFHYSWALGLAGYLLTVFALLSWMTVGRLRIRRWILDGEAIIDPRVLETFREAGLRLGLTCEYPVIEHKTIPAPVACRIFHPVIILPSGFATELSDAELRAVAFHELTHIRRRDTLVFALVSLIRAVFFFQPLVWFAGRRISYLAELACDNAVLDSQADPAAYAEFLTRIAARLPDSALSTELAAGILFSNSSFFRRIKEILSYRREQIKRFSKVKIAGLICAFVLSLVAAAAMPIGKIQEKPVKESLKAGIQVQNTFISSPDAQVAESNQILPSHNEKLFSNTPLNEETEEDVVSEQTGKIENEINSKSVRASWISQVDSIINTKTTPLYANYLQKENLNVQISNVKPAYLQIAQNLEKQPANEIKQPVNDIFPSAVSFAYAWGEQLKSSPQSDRVIANLKNAFLKWKNIGVTAENVMLGTSAIMDYPVLFLSPDRAFRLSETELKNLKNYLDNGGLLVVDNIDTNGTPLGSISQLFYDLFVSESRSISNTNPVRPLRPDRFTAPTPLKPISGSHPIFHSPFELEKSDYSDTFKCVSIQDHLAAVFSNEGFTAKWKENSNNDTELKMGINLILYAVSRDR
jgi:beta-lactamase regulating signal transducer with metallopeptidase domain